MPPGDDQPDQAAPLGEPRIDHEPDHERFTTVVDGHRAELVYHRRGQRLVLVHTGVPDALAGRGVGGALVRAGIDLARGEGLVVVPRCPFARAWLERHPEAAQRIDVEW